MRFLTLMSLILSMQLPAFADHHQSNKEKEKVQCQCSKECKEKCSKGKNPDCTCKGCDCQSSGHCQK